MKSLLHINEAMFQQWSANIGKRAGWMFLFCALVVFTSCDCQDLYSVDEIETRVVCNVDWSVASEHPTGMTLMFYPVDGGEPFVTSTNSVDKAYLSVPAGIYNVFLFNQSVREYHSVSFSGLDKWETIGISVADCDPPSWTQKTGFSHKPAAVYVAVIRNFEYDGVNDAVLNVAPECVMFETEIRIAVDGAKYVRSARGILEGVAKTYFPTRRVTGDVTTKQILDDWRVYTDSEDSIGYVATSVMTLGTAETTRNLPPLLADVEFLLVDEVTMIKHEYDVSSSWKMNPADMTITTLVTEPILIPRVEDVNKKTQGLFGVTMSEWGVPNLINIKL